MIIQQYVDCPIVVIGEVSGAYMVSQTGRFWVNWSRSVCCTCCRHDLPEEYLVVSPLEPETLNILKCKNFLW